MQIIKCWRLESKGEQYNSLVARFTSKEEAENAKDRAGGYGPSIEKEEIIIFDTAIEFDPRLNKKAKQSGLAKLTKEEKEALGIKEK